MEMYPKIRENFKYVVPFFAATNTTELYVETDEGVEEGETFADYVSHAYGSSVATPTSINTNYHPEPTKTGWGGPLATVANPTVVSIESSSETGNSGTDEDGNVVSGQNDSDRNRVSIEHKDPPNGKGDSSDNSKATHTSVTSLTAIVALFVISTSFTF